MFGKKKHKEMQRTCKRCGTKWYVSMRAAKEVVPNRLYRAGIRMQAEGSRMSGANSFGRAGAEMQLSNLERKQDRVEVNSSCPNCGSSNFKQMLVVTKR